MCFARFDRERVAGRGWATCPLRERNFSGFESVRFQAGTVALNHAPSRASLILSVMTAPVGGQLADIVPPS